MSFLFHVFVVKKVNVNTHQIVLATYGWIGKVRDSLICQRQWIYRSLPDIMRSAYGLSPLWCISLDRYKRITLQYYLVLYNYSYYERCYIPQQNSDSFLLEQV